jgi:dipeptide/tripeptide permease
MLIAALSFVVSAIVENVIETKNISVWWQIPQIFLLSAAEILVSISGLEFFYSESPPAMRTATLAAYLCTTSAGDIFGGLLYGTVAHTFSLSQGDILNLCASLMLVASLLCLYFSSYYVYYEHGEGLSPLFLSLFLHSFNSLSPCPLSCFLLPSLPSSLTP